MIGDKLSVVVFGRETTCFNEGSITARVPTVAGALHDLPWALKAAITSRPGSQVTLIYPEYPVALGASDPSMSMTEMLEAEGWTVWTRATNPTSAWLRAHHKATNTRLHLGIRSWAENSDADDQILGARLPDPSLCEMLWRWASLTGTMYAHTPGTAAIINMRQLARASQPHWILQNPATAEYWKPPAQINDIRWRDPNPPAGEHHRWDMRSAYLAAMSAAHLPVGTPRHTGPHEHEGNPGYYRVRILVDRDVPPNPMIDALGQADAQGCVWITSAMLTMLTRGGAAVEIVDSITAPGGRILRGWAENWRDAIAATSATGSIRLQATLKAGYAQAIGLFNVARGTVYRPDWRHIIIDEVRASLLRRIARVAGLATLFPTRVDVDSVWYSAADIDAAGWRLQNMHDALGVHSLIGGMRYEGTEVLT